MMRAVALLLCAPALLAQQPQTPPVFRAGAVLVPLDVRVVDRDGHPVRDLRRDEFVVAENGVEQQIAHFTTHEYERNEFAVEKAVSASGEDSSALSAPTHRTFVFVLGRGRLRGPTKGMQALIEFVRTRLSAGDRVGVVVYDRITHLTSDREAVVRLLELYDERHEEIEALLDHWYSAPLSTYAGLDVPPNLQRRIDQCSMPGVCRRRATS